jgi:hypothetical protein
MEKLSAASTKLNITYTRSEIEKAAAITKQLRSKTIPPYSERDKDLMYIRLTRDGEFSPLENLILLSLIIVGPNTHAYRQRVAELFASISGRDRSNINSKRTRFFNRYHATHASNSGVNNCSVKNSNTTNSRIDNSSAVDNSTSNINVDNNSTSNSTNSSSNNNKHAFGNSPHTPIVIDEDENDSISLHTLSVSVAEAIVIDD